MSDDCKGKEYYVDKMCSYGDLIVINCDEFVLVNWGLGLLCR